MPRKLFELVTQCHCPRCISASFLNLFAPVFRLDEAIGKAVDLVREVLPEQNVEGQCLTEN